MFGGRSVKLKLRFMAGGTIIFLLGLVLVEVRGFQIQEAILLVVGVVLLVAGLFLKDKPTSRPGVQITSP